eukprot:3746369-Rhodomonas_salina.1
MEADGSRRKPMEADGSRWKPKEAIRPTPPAVALDGGVGSAGGRGGGAGGAWSEGGNPDRGAVQHARRAAVLPELPRPHRRGSGRRDLGAVPAEHAARCAYGAAHRGACAAGAGAGAGAKGARRVLVLLLPLLWCCSRSLPASRRGAS